VKIRPAKKLQGEISLPGDKSVSHRAALLGAIANGVTRIGNFATSRDCVSTLGCLKQLGVEISRNGTDIEITGVGKNGLSKPQTPLDCGNSGTTMRLLAGILAGQRFESELTGDDSLRLRPMRRIIEPLTLMGAAVESEDGRAPLKISGGKLSGLRYELPVASAQIKSSVLLAGLYADGTTTVIEGTPTRDHTERMLRRFGVDVSIVMNGECSAVSVTGETELTATEIEVPGDISSGAFFLIAAACLPGSHLKVTGIGLNPTRTALLDVLRRFGVELEIAGGGEMSGEPVGDITVRGRIESTPSTAVNVISGQAVAGLIDELPILAVLGTQLDHGLKVLEAQELRVKESDRISAVVENLKRMNAGVDEFEDGFRVRRSHLRGAKVDSFGDHRIAMAFAVAALLADGETEIAGAECADVSFPGFYDALAGVTVDQ
jgi:3-phosphoshikimate 1-carboxyvinyltransferase